MGAEVSAGGAGCRRRRGHDPEARRGSAGRSILLSGERYRDDARGDRRGLRRDRRGMIFVDSNVPMYLVGSDHPHKAAARRLLEQAIVDNEPLGTDVEVLQELLHRYLSIERRDAIGPAWEAIVGVVDVIHPIELEDVTRARRLIGAASRLSARD